MMKRTILVLALLAAASGGGTGGNPAAQTPEAGGAGELGRLLAGREGVSPALAGAVSAVPRESFVPQGWEDWTYEDKPLPAGSGVFLPSPGDAALLLSAPAIQPDDRVLILGRACGYAAALAAALGADVTVMEENDKQRILLENIIADPPQGLEDMAGVTLLPGWDAALLSPDRLYSVVVVHGGTDALPPGVLGLLQTPGRLAGVLQGRTGYAQILLFSRDGEGESFRVTGEVYFPELPFWPLP